MSDLSPPDSNPTPTEFAKSCEKARNRNGEATAALFLQFNDMLRNDFSRRLRRFRKLGTRYDAEDLCQEVWTSILARGSGQRLCPNLKNLKGYLLGIAGHTFRAVSRAACRRKRDVRRTIHGPLPEGSPGRVLAAAMPDPCLIREAEEAWVLLTFCLPRIQQEVMALLRDGSTSIEAAREAGVSERTVRRVFDRLVASA